MDLFEGDALGLGERQRVDDEGVAGGDGVAPEQVDQVVGAPHQRQLGPRVGVSRQAVDAEGQRRHQAPVLRRQPAPRFGHRRRRRRRRRCRRRVAGRCAGGVRRRMRQLGQHRLSHAYRRKMIVSRNDHELVEFVSACRQSIWLRYHQVG